MSPELTGITGTPSHPPLFEAQIRHCAEDFVVEELSSVQLDGEGEHVWLWLEKTSNNTDYVANCLARAAAVSPAVVGYAGLKDRHAVTRQWFSVQMPGREAPDWNALLEPGMRVLHSARHGRKLKTGFLDGNRFRLVLRDCRGDTAALEARLETIRREGVPNYFGSQRFGRDGGNLVKARAIFEGRLKERNRTRRGLYLSAARSALFNRVLALRVEQGNWLSGLPGDVMNLDGSRSHFAVQTLDETIQRRLAEQDIHPTGPLWGAGQSEALAEVLALEQSVADADPVLAQGLCAAGLKQERRALRLRVSELSHRWLDGDVLELGFILPPGAYATTVLANIANVADAAVAGAETLPEA